VQFRTHLRCLKCKHVEFELIELPEKGKLLTFTILKAPPMEFRDKPSYALGIVEFPNGIKALGQLSREENLEIGMEVEVRHEKICNDLNGQEIYTHVFYPL